MHGQWLGGLLIGYLFVAGASATERWHSPPPSTAERASSAVASSWFELLYEMVRAERIAPPAAARIYGIASVALYEASAAGTHRQRSLVGQLNGLRSLPRPARGHDYYWPAVANAALAETARQLFPAMPASLAAVTALESKLAARDRHRVSARVLVRSMAFGRTLAGGVLAWSASDLYAIHNNCKYLPAPSGPGAWQPTPPAFNANPLQSCWGSIRPMVLNSSDECFAPPPPRFSTGMGSRFHAAALEVYLTGLSLSPEQKTIADYWSDGPGATGTPPGHWIAIVSQLARRGRLSLTDAAEAYARVGIAVHDAFIACWQVKYTHNLLRPVTYINQHIDPGWSPYISTPNFPSYTSGHATQSAAAARVLTAMFGRTRFTDTTHPDHGLIPLQPRTFHSFEQAAEEAARSRLYGGIHFSFDNDSGLAAGRCIGSAIVKRVQFRAR